MYRIKKTLQQFHTIIKNERQCFGAVEADRVVLNDGCVLIRPGILNIDCLNDEHFFLTICPLKGRTFIIHADMIVSIENMKHKRVCELLNEAFKKMKTVERECYFKRFCEVNKHAALSSYIDEYKKLQEDLNKRFD